MISSTSYEELLKEKPSKNLQKPREGGIDARVADWNRIESLKTNLHVQLTDNISV